MLCRYSRAHPYFDDVPVVVVVEAPAPLVWDACLAPLEVGDDRNRRERRGRWAAPAEASTAPAIGALGAKPRRRRSFDAAAGAAPALLHELRSFYDHAYRLKVVKDRLLHEMRHRDWGMAQLFEILDEDGDGELDCDEIGDALRRCGVPLRDLELEELFETLDADESGTVDESEFFDWLYGRGDAWLAATRRSDDDDPFNDRRLLRRDAVRFEDATRRRLHAFWLLVDRDGDGAIDRDEYLDLHVHLYAAMHFGGAEPPDLAEARRVAEREWDFDSQGRDGLDHDLFNLSFFQLVDAWRAAAGDAAASFADYCSFLLDRVAVVVDEDPRHVDLRWRHDPDGWLGDLPRFRSLRKAIASAVREADAMLGVLGLADPVRVREVDEDVVEGGRVAPAARRRPLVVLVVGVDEGVPRRRGRGRARAAVVVRGDGRVERRRAERRERAAEDVRRGEREEGRVDVAAPRAGGDGRAREQGPRGPRERRHREGRALGRAVGAPRRRGGEA